MLLFSYDIILIQAMIISFLLVQKHYITGWQFFETFHMNVCTNCNIVPQILTANNWLVFGK